MGLPRPRSEQMDDAVPARREQLGDEAPVAPPPHGLGAHEARSRLSKRVPQCLLPDGQAFFVGNGASDTCGTLTSAGDPAARRFFSGSKRIVLANTVHGYGFQTNDRGESLGVTRAFCGTSSTYELKSVLTLVRTSGH